MNLQVISKWLLGFLICLSVLVFVGVLNFGHGLGNVIYYLPILICDIVFVLTLQIFIKKKYNQFWSLYIFMLLLVCVAICYKATFGRGPEFPWVGTVFL